MPRRTSMLPNPSYPLPRLVSLGSKATITMAAKVADSCRELRGWLQAIGAVSAAAEISSAATLGDIVRVLQHRSVRAVLEPSGQGDTGAEERLWWCFLAVELPSVS